MAVTAVNAQIPAANTFKPGPTVAEQVTESVKKEQPDSVQQVEGRNEERRETAQAERPAYSSSGSVNAESDRGGSLDISV